MARKRSTRRRSSKRRRSNKKSCPPGQIRRKGYRRKDGTYVKSTCIEDRGAPGKGPDIIPIEHEGKLGGPGYLEKSERTRHGLLNKCVKKWGYKSCLGSINALGVFGKREFSKTQKRKIDKDRDYLVNKFGLGSGDRENNPAIRRRKNSLLRH